MIELLVCVDFDKMDAGGEAEPLDLARLVMQIPSARIIEGDSAFALRVEVGRAERDSLVAHLGARCKVGDYVPLELF